MNPPEGLGPAGSALWASIIDVYEIEPQESLYLAEACREADIVARLESALTDADVTVDGSRGNVRPNPLLTELRGHRDLLARLVARLRLPSEDTDAAKAHTSAMARKAANTRWGN